MEYKVDHTLRPIDQLLGLLNNDNNTTLNSSNVIIGSPQPIIDDTWTKTRVHLTILNDKNENVEECDVTYSRMSLNKLFNFTGLRLPNRYSDVSGNELKVQMLGDIYTKYKVLLHPDDFMVSEVSDGRYRLEATPDNLSFVGTFNGNIILDEIDDGGIIVSKLYGQNTYVPTDAMSLSPPSNNVTYTLSASMALHSQLNTIRCNSGDNINMIPTAIVHSYVFANSSYTDLYDTVIPVVCAPDSFIHTSVNNTHVGFNYVTSARDIFESTQHRIKCSTNTSFMYTAKPIVKLIKLGQLTYTLLEEIKE